jgi:hypothetical protein
MFYLFALNRLEHFIFGNFLLNNGLFYESKLITWYLELYF